MAQMSLEKPLQPRYNYTTRYLPLFLGIPFVSALKTVAYERPKFANVFNEQRQLAGDIDQYPVTYTP
jgi:hypothetical protein